MPKLYVICGHGAGDPGASGNGFDEAERVRALAAAMKKHAGDQFVLCDTTRNYYVDMGILGNSIPSDATILELHMDCADIETAKGGHILTKSGFDINDYDKALAEFISSFFPGRAESVQYVGWLANANRAAAVGKDYRLIECGFISNYDDVKKFNEHIDELACGLLKCFGIECDICNHDKPPVPDPNPTPSNGGDGGVSGSFESGAYICTVDYLNVRTAPSVSSPSVAHYEKNDEVILDGWYTIADGYVWGRYIGASSGQYRYVAVGKPTGKPEGDDYLIKY